MNSSSLTLFRSGFLSQQQEKLVIIAYHLYKKVYVPSFPFLVCTGSSFQHQDILALCQSEGQSTQPFACKFNVNCRFCTHTPPPPWPHLQSEGRPKQRADKGHFREVAHVLGEVTCVTRPERTEPRLQCLQIQTEWLPVTIQTVCTSAFCL